MRLSHDDEERRRQIEELEKEHKNTERLRELLAKAKADGQKDQDAAENVEDPFAKLENENAERENAPKDMEDPFAVLERKVLEKEAEVERRTEDFLKGLQSTLGDY